MLFGLATITELAATIYVNKKRKVQLALEPGQTTQSSAKKETIAKDTEEREKGRRKKKILITGSGSYVGTSVEAWLRQWPEYYQVDTLDMRTKHGGRTIFQHMMWSIMWRESHMQMWDR